MGRSRQMIVPQTHFFCNGRINGLIVSLNLDDDSDEEYPYIQVWRNSSSDIYILVGQYRLQESDISRRQNYYLANATLNRGNRIEFQSRDVIGYYHPSNPRYRVWSVENARGYTVYSVNSESPLNMLNIRRGSLSENQDDRPLIQVLYGMCLIDVMCIILAMNLPSDNQCVNLSTPVNGEIMSCSSGRVGVGYEGDTCSFTCNTGYELTGSDTRTCQSDGSWSGTDDMCGRGLQLECIPNYVAMYIVMQLIQFLAYHLLILPMDQSIVHWEMMEFCLLETHVTSYVALDMS